MDIEVTELMDDFDWYFLPIANPDGYEYTHTNVSFVFYLRQNIDYIFLKVVIFVLNRNLNAKIYFV